MYTKQQELLQSQTSAEQANNSSSSVNWTIKKIKGSPYTIIGDEEQGYIVTYSKWKLCEPQRTEEAAEKWLKENIYDVILKTIICVIDQDNEMKNQQFKTI